MTDQDLYARFDLLRGAEDQKNELITEILRQLDKLTNDYQQMTLDYQREAQYNRDTQLRQRKLSEDLRLYRAMVERDAFILVLIDGDGMVFGDQMIQKGELGGKEAANKLWNAIRDNVHQTMPSLTPEYKIVTRIYANLKGLATTLYYAGIVEKPTVVEEFARGFTGSKQLFDFVDVGSGKDRADDKIIEVFKLHLYNCHCRHIFFGCSHDNGYARLLEDLADQPGTGRITLMEGVPFERELSVLKSKYETTQFQNLFRTDKIKIYQQPGYGLQTTLPHQTHPSYSMPPPALPSPQQQPTTQSGSGLRYHVPPEPPSSNNKPNATPSPVLSNATSGSSNAPPALLKPATWASTTAAAAPLPALASPPPTPSPAIIPRNKYGQRVDPPSTYNKTESHRIRALKLCNLHYLRGDCPYDPCHHDHYYKISKSELATLQYVARMVPCQWGTECDDPKCIYGHRCPANYEGTECRFGAECNFPAEMHGVDGTVVRTTRVGKK